MADVKICGLSDAAGVAASIAGRARWIGFNFFPRSPRYVTAERAAALAAPARGRVETVAIVVDPDDALLGAIASTLAPDWVQLHGKETPARVAAVKRFARIGVIKAIGIARAEDFADVDRYAAVADMMLFDAKAPESAAMPGGLGTAFDWRLLQGRRVGEPWLLSGGLTPENVAEAVRESGADAVDVSSGVESAPGVKDPALIARFLAAAIPS